MAGRYFTEDGDLFRVSLRCRETEYHSAALEVHAARPLFPRRILTRPLFSAPGAGTWKSSKYAIGFGNIHVISANGLFYTLGTVNGKIARLLDARADS